MKNLTFYCLTLVLIISVIQKSYTQTYNSSYFAKVCDYIYLTQSNEIALDYSQTGSNFTWNLQNLISDSPEKIEFKSLKLLVLK